jgi:tetratricopeptide (TPR) repeat protein
MAAGARENLYAALLWPLISLLDIYARWAIARGEAWRVTHHPLLRLMLMTARGRRVISRAEQALGISVAAQRQMSAVEELRDRLRAAREFGKRDREAEETLRKDGSEQSLIALARHYIALGEFQECTTLLKQAPQSRALRQMSVRLALATGQSVEPELLKSVSGKVHETPLLVAATLAQSGTQATLGLLENMKRNGVVDFLTGHVALFADRPDLAVARLESVLSRDACFGEALSDLALAHERQGNLVAAEDAYRKAIDAAWRPHRRTPHEAGLAIPSRSNTIFRYLAMLAAAGRREEATALLWDIPDPVATKAASFFKAKPWRGEALDGKGILVLNRRGLGDQLRSLAALERLRPSVKLTLAVEQRIARMISCAFPGFDVRAARHNDFNSLAGNYDFVADGEFMLRLATLQEPQVIKHTALVPLPACAEEMKPGIAARSGLRIALGWRSLLPGIEREIHDLSTRALANIGTRSDITFIPLQPGQTEEEIRVFGNDPGIDTRDDLEAVLAALSHCDVCIATPSALCELAGAAGIPTLQIIKFPVGFTLWRFDENGHDRLWPWMRALIAKTGESEEELAARAVDAAQKLATEYGRHKPA